MSRESAARAAAITLLRLGISLGILAWLVVRLRGADPASFSRLRTEPLNGSRLVLGWLAFSGEIVGVSVRWWLTMRAAGLHHRLTTAVRYGLLAHALNFLALGVVGGDVVKALLIARDHPRQRLQTIATVVVDRIIGLQCLLSFLALQVWWLGSDHFGPVLRPWLEAIASLAIVGLLGLLLFLLSDRAGVWLTRLALPRFLLDRLRALTSLSARFRRRWPFLVVAVALSLGILGLQVCGFFLLATSLPGEAPTLPEQMVIVPLAVVSGVVPLPASALGVLDLAVSVLYSIVTGGRVPPAQGLLAVMLSRLMGASVAAVGLWLYLRRRKEIQTLIAADESRRSRV